jgi:hypothetical protein
LDVQNTFLLGVLDEDIYMKQSPRFVDHVHPSYHCKLDKALYGVKQAPQAWYSRLSDKLSPSVCFLLARSSCTTKVTSPFFLLVYVDDVIVASSSNQAVDALLLDFQNDFILKELGPLHFFPWCPSHTDL